MGQGGGQQRHTSAVSSEKWWDSVAAYGAEMRVIATFFGLYAPDALPSYISVFSHDFKRFERCTKLATSSWKNTSIAWLIKTPCSTAPSIPNGVVTSLRPS